MKQSEGCYICGYPYTEVHHIFYGTGNRKLSDEYGLTVRLCARHHRDYRDGVHGCNKELDYYLRRKGQEAFKEAYPDLDFIKLFGSNYL